MWCAVGDSPTQLASWELWGGRWDPSPASCHAWRLMLRGWTPVAHPPCSSADVVWARWQWPIALPAATAFPETCFVPPLAAYLSPFPQIIKCFFLPLCSLWPLVLVGHAQPSFWGQVTLGYSLGSKCWRDWVGGGLGAQRARVPSQRWSLHPVAGGGRMGGAGPRTLSQCQITLCAGNSGDVVTSTGLPGPASGDNL